MTQLAKIIELQEKMLELPQAEIEIVHHHAPGIYCREMRAPQGSLIVGKMHKTEHLNILSKGSVLITGPDGISMQYDAPALIHSYPGAKRVLLALTDYVWTNIHHNPNSLIEEDDIQKFFVVEPGTELEFVEKLLLEEK